MGRREPFRVGSKFIQNYPWRNGCILQGGPLVDFIEPNAPENVDPKLLFLAKVSACFLLYHIAIL